MDFMGRESEMFGEALKRRRLECGLTQEALAHEAGITTSYTTLPIILRLCRALDCTPGELLSDFTPAVLKRLKFE
jgi:DNA-binding Xre family transcriptional regulator